MEVTVNNNSFVLPRNFWGCYAGIYFNQDSMNAAFQQLAKAMRPEVWNFVNQNPRIGTGIAPFVNQKQLALALVQNDPHVIQNIQLSARPAAKNYGGSAQSAGIAPNGSGFSPADQAALIGDWVGAGINVRGVDTANEPSLVAAQTDDGSPWFTLADSTQASFRCQDWYAINQRAYADAIRAKAAQLGIPIAVNLGTTAGCEADSFAFATANTISGQMWASGDANPNSPVDNLAHFDRVSIHPYCGQLAHGAGGPQARLNRLFWDGSDVTSWDPLPGVKTYIDSIRAYMDAHGAADKQIVVTECGADWKGTPAMWVPLVDVGYAILFAQHQAEWNLAYYLHTEFGRGFGTGGLTSDFGMADLMSGMPTGSGNEVTPSFPANPSDYMPNARYHAIKDIGGMYAGNCKQQIATTVTVPCGMTPATAEGTSIPRIQYVLGRHDTLPVAVLEIGNFDLTNPEPIVFHLGFSPADVVTGVRLTQQQGLGAAPAALPPITPVGQDLVFTLPAGDAWLLRIPLPAPPVTGMTVGRQSIQPGQRLTGLVQWDIITNGPVDHVECYANGVKLADVQGRMGSFRYILDTTLLPDGPTVLGVILADAAATKTAMTTTNVTIDNTRPPGGWGRNVANARGDLFAQPRVLKGR